MGKSLKGKELGRGITQRKDGRYQIQQSRPITRNTSTLKRS